MAPIRREITRHIRWLERRIAAVDRDLDDTIQRSPVWRAKEHLLRTAPGVLPVLSRTLLADLPELGQLTRKQFQRSWAWRHSPAPAAHFEANALLGAAARRSAPLYMGELVAARRDVVICAFYRRLVAAGKLKKVESN